MRLPRHALAQRRREPLGEFAISRHRAVLRAVAAHPEAFTLSTDRDTVRTVSPEIRRMLGYSIHPPFIGMVDGMHLDRLLTQ